MSVEAPERAEETTVSVPLPGLDFVAIDFETANPKRASVCQIGIAKIRNGIVTHRATEYVMPPEGFRNFAHWNIKIHGITRPKVNGAPEWPAVLSRIEDFHAGLPLVSHNVAVERSIIKQASEACGIVPPDFEYLCTQKLAEHRLPEETSYRLNNLVESLRLTEFKHHDAGEDAVACANLVIHIARVTGITDLEELWPPARTYPRGHRWR